MKTLAIEDYEAIAKQQKINEANKRRECIRRVGGVPVDCWCWGAGPNNSNLPCPSQSADYGC